MSPSGLVKEVAVFLGASGMSNPNDEDWEAALRLILFHRKIQLDARERGEFNMIRHDMFKDGVISDDFIKRESPESFENLKQKRAERNGKPKKSGKSK